MNEITIIQDVIAGDTEAYASLVARYHVGLIIHCEQLVGDRDTAEDIAQEAFIKAFNNLHTFDGTKSRFSTWLYKIATNKAIDYMRKNGKQSTGDYTELFADTAAPDFEAEQERREVQDAVTALMPPEYRKVIEAYYWRGQSYQQIAEDLDVPLGTVRTWLHRAKTQLRSDLS